MGPHVPLGVRKERIEARLTIDDARLVAPEDSWSHDAGELRSTDEVGGHARDSMSSRPAWADQVALEGNEGTLMTGMLDFILDFVIHADTHLASLVQQYGTTTYVILFAIIFAETGLVVTPFLPGDSLLFAAGALAATGTLQIEVLVPVMIAAAVIGNAVNYMVGRRIAHMFQLDAPETSMHRWVKREYVHRAHEFFERHGGRAVVLARFVPIVRTFLPFVAGGAGMSYREFTIYNVTGCLLWVGVCVGAGYLFGNIPIVKNNFTLVALGIVAVSLLPMVIELAKARRRPAS